MKTPQQCTSSQGAHPPPNPAAIGRRRLLTGVLALTGSASAAVIVAEDHAGAVSAHGSDPTSLTYRETEHIRQFYARCRF